MPTFLRRLSTAAFLTAALVSAPAGAALLSSAPLPQDGIAQSIKPPQEGTIGTFTFADPAATLASLTGLELTLTMSDGDTGTGQFDAGDLTLALDGIDTGLLLDGFAGGQTVTRTLSLTGLGSALAQSLFAALTSDGQFVATILDADNDTTAGFRDHTNGKNFFTLASGYDATLTLAGAASLRVAPNNNAIPEPATLALTGLGVAGVMLSKRRRSR